MSAPRHKEESSSSDEDHRAAKPSSPAVQSELAPGGVSYKKTLRLTSEQLVSSLVLRHKRCNFFWINYPSNISFLLHLLSSSHTHTTAVSPAAGWPQRCGVQCHHSVPGNLPLPGNHLPLELGRQDHHFRYRWNHHQVGQYMPYIHTFCRKSWRYKQNDYTRYCL